MDRGKIDALLENIADLSMEARIAVLERQLRLEYSLSEAGIRALNGEIELEALAKSNLQLERRVREQEEYIFRMRLRHEEYIEEMVASPESALYRRMRHERDKYQRMWRSLSQRMGEMMEHQGSIEYLEARLQELERENSQLRAHLKAHQKAA